MICTLSFLAQEEMFLDGRIAPKELFRGLHTDLQGEVIKKVLLKPIYLVNQKLKERPNAQTVAFDYKYASLVNVDVHSSLVNVLSRQSPTAAKIVKSQRQDLCKAAFMHISRLSDFTTGFAQFGVSEDPKVVQWILNGPVLMVVFFADAKYCLAKPTAASQGGISFIEATEIMNGLQNSLASNIRPLSITYVQWRIQP